MISAPCATTGSIVSSASATRFTGPHTRARAKEGVLAVAQRARRLLLDVRSVHEVSHIVRDLRALGQDRDLLAEVWRRLGDAALLERPGLRESIEQMRRGEGQVLRPLAGKAVRRT